jgi:leukotriene A-4 hydrolase/aminopeptidase
MNLTIDFEARVVRGRVRLELERPTQGPLDLDTRDLEIQRVEDSQARPMAWSLGEPDPILGRRLRLQLPEGTDSLEIHYSTSPGASALQWLQPSQTAGGRHPYLFSQCQAIHARSLVPLQDTPRCRLTFQAEIEVAEPLRVVMAAAREGSEPGQMPGRRVYRFRMPQPIPPYLLAVAAGNLEERRLGPRSSVFSEPEMLERAAWEFAGVEDMIAAAEGLFGPYRWDRFDILCMPPSFPYGGMENPRLTFLTPSLLAGDRSLVNVLAHELAHSWTGNLVTNASMEHFWLNEGFTVYAERRILEALEGAEATALHAAIGRQGLGRELARFGEGSPHTRLRTELHGVDPDEVFSLVPYEKGYLFVRLLHEAAGQERFDAFLRRYIERFAFQSITTEEFLAFVEDELPGVLGRVRAREWLYEPGLPDNEPLFPSRRKEAAESLARAWSSGARPGDDVAGRWAASEWLLYLEALPRPMKPEECRELDERFRLTDQGNSEILSAWLGLGIVSGYAPAVERAAGFLGEIGRMKFLRPLYTALAANPSTRERARALFEELRESYHPIAQAVVEGILR